MEILASLPHWYAPRTPPFEHQATALVKGWERTGFGYLMEMGTGKTRTTIDDFCINYHADECHALLVVAPKSVYTNWSRWDDDNPGEVQKWLWENMLDDLRMHTYRAGGAKRDLRERTWIMDGHAPGPRILVVNVEALSMTKDAEELCRKFLRAHKTMIAVDESTVAKNPKSSRTKALLRLARLAAKRRILTGSPSTGSQADLWSQFEFLGPGEALLGHRLYSTFRARYCDLRPLFVNGREVKVEKGPLNTAELARVVQEHSYRRRKEDCLDLPAKTFLRREVELTDDQRQTYRELKETAMAIVNGEEVTTEIVITQLMRMHQVVCGHVRLDDGRVVELPTKRLDAVDELIDETDAQTILWAMYRPDAERVSRHLRQRFGADSVSEWHGGRTQPEREAGEARFQSGQSRFMVATKAGARGRTWTAGTLAVYYSNDHDLEIRQQSEDRCHRIGTVRPVTYVDIVAPGTVDEKIIRSLRSKRSVAAAVMAEGLGAWI